MSAMSIRLAGAVLVLAAAAPAAAAVVAAESFETPALTAPAVQYGPDQSATYDYNTTGSASAPGFTFGGFSGKIVNGTLGVFPNATDGVQAAFVQGYQGNGAQIDWAIGGLTPGKIYTLTFDAAGSFIVPAEPFTVSLFGVSLVPVLPAGPAYAGYSLSFVAPTASGIISFIAPADANNAASAIDNLVLSTVPEPASWTLLIAGFGLAGAALRRRSPAAAPRRRSPAAA